MEGRNEKTNLVITNWVSNIAGIFLKYPERVNENMFRNIIRFFEGPSALLDKVHLTTVHKSLNDIKEFFEMEDMGGVTIESSFYPDFSLEKRKVFIEQVRLFNIYYVEYKQTLPVTLED